MNLKYSSSVVLSLLLYPGYASVSSESSVETQNNKGYRTDSIQKISEIVVTGTNLATSRSQLPYSISIINKEELEESGENKILNVLSGRIPSLFVTERGIGGFGISTGGSGGIKIRGVGGSPTSQILMMVDGQPQFAGNYSHHVADTYTMDFAEKVEVIRGPASVLYGSNAMGGAINIITSNAQKEGVHNTLNAQYGSYNTANFDYVNKVRYGNFSSVISLNYLNTDGISQDFDFKQYGGYAKIRYDVTKNWNLSADYNVMKFEGKDPTYITEEQPYIYEQNIIRGAGSVNINNKYDKTSGSVKVFYSYGNHFVYDPKPFHSLDDHFGIIAYQSFSLGEGNNVTAGIDYTDYSGKIPLSGGTEHKEGSMTTFDRKHISEFAPYLVASQNLLKELITLNAGVRYVHNDKFGDSWIPQGGITLFPKCNTIIKGSVAKGYRNPSFKELYLYRMANPELKPESMMNYEVSVVQYAMSRRLRAELTGYIAKGKDLIQSVAHPELGHPLNENTGKFENKGIEASLSYMILPSLSAESTYSYMHTDIENLTGAPKNQFFFGVNWQALKKLRIDMQLRSIGGLFVHQSMEKQDYTLLNSKITYIPAGNIEVYALLDNITDKKYTINYNYEMPGFMINGGIKVRF